MNLHMIPLICCGYRTLWNINPSSPELQCAEHGTTPVFLHTSVHSWDIHLPCMYIVHVHSVVQLCTPTMCSTTRALSSEEWRHLQTSAGTNNSETSQDTCEHEGTYLHLIVHIPARSLQSFERGNKSFQPVWKPAGSRRDQYQPCVLESKQRSTCVVYITYTAVKQDKQLDQRKDIRRLRSQ